MQLVVGLQRFIQKAFDIRQGEFKIALLLQANIFLIIATLLIIKPIVNALFIDRFGVDSLPQAYVVLAIVAIIGSLLYSAALNKFKLIKVILRTLSFSALALIVFGVLLSYSITVGWVIYLFYIWTAIFAVLSASQFWILANVVFNIREAKRIFSFIGAGAISGGIVGGYLTSLFVEFTGTTPLLFVAAFLLLLCIPINLLVWKESAGKYSQFRRKKRLSLFTDSPLKAILQSRLLSLLAAILGMSVLVAKLVDYQFSDIASVRIPDPDDLAQFFAFWSSNLNVISLLVQLLLTRWIVGKHGVGTSLLVLPVGIALGAIITFSFPELWAVILLKSVDGSLKQSVNKSAVELLGLPIPFEIKNRTKTFIDVVVDSVATGVAGFILIFIINGLDLGSEVVSAVIFILVSIWIWLALKVKKEYISSFQVLSVGKLTQKSTAKPFQPTSVIDSLKKIIESGKLPQLHYILDQLKYLPDQRFVQYLLPLIDYEDETVVAKALHNLRFFDQQLISNVKLEKLLVSANEEVRIEALMYLLKYNKNVSIVENYLQSEDQYLSATALLALTQNARSSFTLRSSELITSVVKDKMIRLASIQDEELKLFIEITLLKVKATLRREEDLQEIESYLSHENPILVKQAISSAAFSLNERFIVYLVNLLSHKEYRAEAKKGLHQYGVPIIQELGNLVRRKEVPVASLHFIPSVLELFNSQKAVVELFQLLDHADLAVRLESIRSLNKLQANFPDLNIHKRDVVEKINTECKIYLQTLNMMHTQVVLGFRNKDKNYTKEGEIGKARKSLMKLLESRMEGHLERIFGLLGLTYPSEEMNKTYEAIQSEHADMRVNAIEYLDNLLDGDLKRILIPIVEISILDSISEEVLNEMNLKVMGEFECFSLILKRNDTKLKLAVIYLIGLLKDQRYQPILQSLKHDPNLKIRDYVAKALVKN